VTGSLRPIDFTGNPQWRDRAMADVLPSGTVVGDPRSQNRTLT
jgi:hypothetical protein